MTDREKLLLAICEEELHVRVVYSRGDRVELAIRLGDGDSAHYPISGDSPEAILAGIDHVLRFDSALRRRIGADR